LAQGWLQLWGKSTSQVLFRSVVVASAEAWEGPRKLMFVQIADALGRFEILSDAFITEADFQQTLAVFYADILQFHKHAYKFVRRSGKWEAFCSTF
jgi:hypothetical protein